MTNLTTVAADLKEKAEREQRQARKRIAYLTDMLASGDAFDALSTSTAGTAMEAAASLKVWTGVLALIEEGHSDALMEEKLVLTLTRAAREASKQWSGATTNTMNRYFAAAVADAVDICVSLRRGYGC